MNLTVLLLLSAACLLMMLLERLGMPTTLQLDFKGDLKRESRWFAQYGQAACTLVTALLLWQLDRRDTALAVLVAVFGTSIAAMVLKRLLSRVRPGREHAGRFLGPAWRHANWRESFPSSHSACAVALSAVLAAAFPPIAPTVWTLAIVCALLRYLMDAHWPSDVLGGIALGYGLAHAAMHWLAVQ